MQTYLRDDPVIEVIVVTAVTVVTVVTAATEAGPETTTQSTKRS